MDRTRLREIVEELNQEKDRQSYRKYQFAENVSKVRLKNAINTYAQGARVEDIVAILDSTITNNGKDGFLVTENYLYGKCLKGGPIELDKLRFVTMTDARPSQFALVYKDGTVYETKIGESNELKKEMSFFVKLTGHEPAEERSAGRGEEFYQRYRASIRRRIEEIVERYSQKNSQYRFGKSEEIEVLKGRIERAGADVRPEDVLAVHNIGVEEGKIGALFTERAYYQGYYSRKFEPLYYIGLEMIVPIADKIGKCLLIYENGYICRWTHYNGEKSLEDLEMIKEILAVYHEIENHPPVNEGAGLYSITGWKEFTDRRRVGALEAYKNSVFVSSTFKDMHYERDIIHEKVLPALNEAGLEYGQTISFCDLRWGVNTGELDSEEGSRKVLSVCLDEIERCRPYMIVILGERYGWIPEERMIENALEGRPDFTLDELEKSVTALEIEFGALANAEQMKRTFFYFREIKGEPTEIYKSEDVHHAEKLLKLKARIRKLAGEQVRNYTVSWDEENQGLAGLDEFARMAAEDIQSVMEEEWRKQAAKTMFQKEMEMHWELAEKKALQCAARDELALSCLTQLEQGERMIVITGESGSGKSTLMGCLAVVLRLSGAQVLPVFCGYTARSDTALEVTQSIVHFLEELLGKGQGEENVFWSEKEWLERMELLTEEYTEKGECQAVIVVDAVDQLMACGLRDELKFLPPVLTDKVRVILSCLTDFPLPYVPNVRELPLMEDMDKPEVIRGILRLHRRELEEPVIDAIAAKPFSDHPLYMSLLIQRMLMMNKNDFDEIAGSGDGMSAITRHQLEMVEKCADDLPGICREILKAAAARIGGGFVEKAMQCLAVSRHGLRDSDLEGILTLEGIEWNGLDFSLFINYLRSMFLIRDDGRVDFSHKIFREGVTGNLNEEENMHESIWKWLKNLPENDEVRRQELVYHELRGDKKAELLADITAHEGDVTFLKRAAKEIAVYSRADGGAWLAESLQDIEGQEETAENYINFLVTQLHQEFSSYGEDGKLKEKLYLAALPVAKWLADENPTVGRRRNKGTMYSRLGVIYKGRDEENEYSRALPYFEEALKISKELEKEDADSEIKLDLVVDYRMLGDIYLKIGGDKNHEQAVRCYEESIRLAEEAVKERPGEKSRSHLGWSYQKMESMLLTDGENEKALQYCRKCIAVREMIAEESQTSTAWVNLCYIYNDAAYICRLSDDKDRLQEGLGMYEKEAALWEKIVMEERTVEHVRRLGVAYMGAGDMLRYLDAEGNSGKIVEQYAKAIPVLEEVCKVKAEVREKLAKSCKFASEHSQKLEGASNHARSKEWGRKALALYEELAKEKDTEDAYLEWARMLYLFIKFLNGTQGCNIYLEQYLELLKLLYAKTGDKSYKKNMKQVKLLMKMEGIIWRL